MSIILQHEFWDLVVTQDAFEVSLNFSRKPERLTVPFNSITGFSPIRRCRSASSSSRGAPTRDEPRAGWGGKQQPASTPPPARPARAAKDAVQPVAAGEDPPNGRRSPPHPPAKPKSCRSTPSVRSSRGTLERNRQSAPCAKAKRAPARGSRLGAKSSPLWPLEGRETSYPTRTGVGGGPPRGLPDRWARTPVMLRMRASSNARLSSPAIAPAFPSRTRSGAGCAASPPNADFRSMRWRRWSTPRAATPICRPPFEFSCRRC